MKTMLSAFLTLLLLSAAGVVQATPISVNLTNAVVVTRSGERLKPEQKAATVLVEEVQKRTGLTWTTTTTMPASGAAISLELQTGASIAAEGYRLFVDTTTPGLTLVRVVGADGRGVLYGVGRFLRTMTWATGSVTFPQSLDETTSPQYSLRGHQLGYRATANTYDAWSLAQYEQYIRDLAIFGANAIENTPFDSTSPHYTLTQTQMNHEISSICDAYGIAYWVWTPIQTDISVPANRAAELARHATLYQNCTRLDGVFVPGGDPGSTPVELLLPFLQDLSGILAQYHPAATLWVSNQGFGADKDTTLFSQLSSQQPTWLTGLVYGPWVWRSLQSEHSLTPARYMIRSYPDISHNVRCQYPVPDWDRALAHTLNREGCNPRPVEEAAIQQFEAPYTDGFLAYSDGAHDDVNKQVWTMRAWDPNITVNDILTDYARFFFSPQAASGAATGILELEQNWHGPLATNAGVDTTFTHWTAMETANPGLATNWRWQFLLQRAYYDKYTKERLIYENGLEDQAKAELENAPLNGSNTAMTQAEAILSQATTAPVQTALRTRILDLCAALYQSIRYQSSVSAPYLASGLERSCVRDLVDWPINDRLWYEGQFESVRSLTSETDRLLAIRQMLRWEDAGPGGYYDDLGNATKQPHLVRPTAYDPGYVSGTQCEFSWHNGDRTSTTKGGGRLSWQDLAQTLYGQPLTMTYTGLEAEAQYTVRATYLGRFSPTMTLSADGTALGTATTPPGDFPYQVEYTIPKTATADGQVTLTWDLVSGRGCQVAEVWLSTPDSDDDGLPDYWEERYRLNPYSAVGDDGGQGDPDDDGLTNVEEFQRSTSPTSPDTDGDQWLDPTEIACGTDPLDIGSHPTGLPVNVSIFSPLGSPTSVSPIPVTITFTEPVTGFSAAGIHVENGTVSDFAGSGAEYTASITPSSQGNLVARVMANTAHDAGGSPNAASPILWRTYDSIGPAVSFESTSSPSVIGPVSVTVTLNESSTDFQVGDIVPANCVVSGFSGAGTLYFLTLTPVAPGAFSCSVPEAALHDLAGNGNPASGTFERTFTPTAVTAVLSTLSSSIVDGAIAVTVTLSESTTDFNQADLIASNATISNFAGGGAMYGFTLTPTTEGVFSAAIPEGAFHGAGGGTSTASNVLERRFSLAALTTTIRCVNPDPAHSLPIVVTVKFGRAVTGFTAGSVNVSGATLADFAGTGTTYVFSLRPTSPDTLIALYVPAGAVRGAAGEGNTASNVFSIRYDTVPPDPPVVTGATPTIDTTPTWTWTSGGNGGSGLFRYLLDSASTWSEAPVTAFTPLAGLPEGVHTLTVQERDAAGNWSPSGLFSITVMTHVSISGRITNAGIGLQGVTLSGFPSAVRTDAQGHYVAAVPSDWHGVITPSSQGRTFTPASRTYSSLTGDLAEQDYTSACVNPGEPVGLSASDGTFTTHVHLTWNAGTGATGYNVYRAETNNATAAQKINDIPITGLAYDDTAAVAPLVEVEEAGCNQEAITTISYHKHYYWVRAVNACSFSAFSDGDEGYRGTDVVAKAYETVLPRTDADGVALIAGTDTHLSVRLRAEAAIDPASIWGSVSIADAQTSEAIAWVPVSDRDGWVVFTPETPWVAGTAVTMTVGGKDVNGNVLEQVTAQFSIATEPAKASTPIAQPETPDRASVVAEDGVAGLEGGVGPVYRVGPGEVFDVPQRVWLPVPKGGRLSELALYYQYRDSWRAAETIEGLIVPDSLAMIDSDGTTYLGVLVRHGGTIQLGPADAIKVTSASAGVLPLTNRLSAASGDLMVLVGACLLVWAAGRIGQRKRAQD